MSPFLPRWAAMVAGIAVTFYPTVLPAWHTGLVDASGKSMSQLSSCVITKPLTRHSGQQDPSGHISHSSRSARTPTSSLNLN